MFKNYFKTAWRNVWKNKVFSAINIVGLAIGLAACIIIMLFVFYEKSFDRMHQKNIYRLDEVQNFPGMVAPQNVALSMFPMAPTLKAEFPEVRNFTRVNYWGKINLNYGDKKIYFENGMAVDSTFLQIFDFKLIKGDRQTVLQKPRSLVLTEENAAKMFGKEDPIGKTLIHYGNDTTVLTVTGVIQDAPKNSHLKYDMLVSFNTIYGPDNMNNWGGNWLVTYLELAPNTNISGMEKKFPAYLQRHMKGDGPKFYTLFLQSLKDVHSGSTNITHDYVNYQKFDKSYTYIFTVIALIVLVIAAINFMNLSTARSAERAREVGIRKSIGAYRFQLGFQFIAESVLLALISLVLAIALVKLFLPSVAQLSQRDLQLPFFTGSLLIPAIIGATIIVGILAGLYPAAYLSSFNPVKVLKGSVQTGKSKGLLRNILVVAQFSSAVFLIIATVFAVRQLRFMETKDPGFNRDQVMIIPFNDITIRNYKALKDELIKNTLISYAAGEMQELGNNLHQNGVSFKGDGPLRDMTSSRQVADPDFLRLYKIPVIYGRDFSNEAHENGKTYIINETLAKELLKDNPKASMETLVGKRFGYGEPDSLGTIIGIAKDFNFNSLHHKIETLFIYNQTNWGFNDIAVRIDGKRAKEAVAYVEAVWNRINPGQSLEYGFLDEHFAELYKADSQVSKIVGALAILSIIISCLGLFGLASYAAERRIKEIGIRKVLGASVQSIVSLISGNFIRLVLISNLIAWPVAWWALNNWLQDFAYRVDISWWVFIAAGIIAVLIALATISFQAIRAALSNPVKSLRTE